jgi:hypothetical protein
MADPYVVAKSEQDRLETLTLTRRYIVHVLRCEHLDEADPTLESVRRAYRPPKTIGDLYSFAQLVNLEEFTRVLPPATRGRSGLTAPPLRMLRSAGSSMS